MNRELDSCIREAFVPKLVCTGSTIEVSHITSALLHKAHNTALSAYCHAQSTGHRTQSTGHRTQQRAQGIEDMA